MSIESYIAWIDSEGGSIKGATNQVTKLAQLDMIRKSPSSKIVKLNNIDEYSIVSDIDTFEYRRFLFEPDKQIYKGNYINHDGFTYLITEHTTDEIYPQAMARLCNYKFLVKVEEIKTQVGNLANGRPKYDIKKNEIYTDAVMTDKIYSSIDNRPIAIQDGSSAIFIPYIDSNSIPKINQVIMIETSQYKVVDISYKNVLDYNGIKKGYIDIRLQKEVASNV